MDDAQPSVLLWADVLHPLSPVSDFLRCRLGTAAVAPEIQPGPEEARALLNGSAVLPCRAEGWPVPRVTWWKDGRLLPLRGNNRYEALRVGGTKSWLWDCATLHINRCFGMPGAGMALSPHEGLCSVPVAAQQTCATSGCNVTCHLPSCVSPCVAARPCRTPTGLPRSPSPGCSSCQMALCKLTPFRSGIRAITSAWHLAPPALTGEAWTSTSWVSGRATRIPPGLTSLCSTHRRWAALIGATMCCCPLLIASVPFHSPSRHRPWALQRLPAGSAACRAALRCLGIPRALH